MAIRLVVKTSDTLRRRLREISTAVDPKSSRMDRFRTTVKQAIVADNAEKLLGYGSSALAGVDRYGKDLAAPARSTVKSWRLRIGRVLAPEGLQSRAITRFKVRWQLDGRVWKAYVGWDGIPWMLYHLRGASRGSNPRRPNWSLPKRDISGTSPRGWVKIRAEFARFAKNLARSGNAE